MERGGRRCGGGHGGGRRSLKVVGKVLGLAWCLGQGATAMTIDDDQPTMRRGWWSNGAERESERESTRERE